MNKVTYQGMEFDEEELKEIRKENRNNQSSINIFDFTRMVNPFNFDYKKNKTYKAIITDIPGSGKTTSIFQYMRDRLKTIGTYHAVYSASRISDIYHMFLKFVAEFGDKYKFSLFTSDKNYCNVKDLTELYYSRIIFLCHERLFIEPVSLIYNVKYTELEEAMFDIDLSYKRDDILIDEIPSNLYRSLNLKQKGQLELLNYLSFGKDKDFFRQVVESNFNLNSEDLRFAKNTARANFIKSAIQARTDKKVMTKSLSESNEVVGTNQSLALSLMTIDNAPTTIANPSKSITKDIAGAGINSTKGLFMLKKLTYFVNIFANKYEENPEADYILYSPDDFDCKRLIFFSGTGDLLARNSTKYKIINSREGVSACRFLDLYDTVKLVSPRLTRKATSDLIAKEYSEILIQILKDNPEETVLAYLWKDSKNKEEKFIDNYDYELNDNYSILPAKILKLIPEDLQIRIKFITYQSGKEQSTNEYLDCGVMVILGEFFVPQEVINCRNLVFGSESTNLDYTKHLIIQAIYRTRARQHSKSDRFIEINGNRTKANSIKLYIDDRYGDFIKSLLGEFRLVNCNSIDNKKLRLEHIYLSEFEFPEELIEEKSITGNDFEDYFVINSKNLASIISNMKTAHSIKLKKILENSNIVYEVINPNSTGRNHYTKYKIYPYRIVHRIKM